MGVGIALAAVGAVILGAPALVAGVVAAIVFAVANLVIVIKEHWTKIGTFLSGLWENIKTLAGTAWQGNLRYDWKHRLWNCNVSFRYLDEHCYNCFFHLDCHQHDRRWHCAGYRRYNHEYLERICVGFRPAARSLSVSV